MFDYEFHFDYESNKRDTYTSDTPSLALKPIAERILS